MFNSFWSISFFDVHISLLLYINNFLIINFDPVDILSLRTPNHYLWNYPVFWIIFIMDLLLIHINNMKHEIDVQSFIYKIIDAKAQFGGKLK